MRRLVVAALVLAVWTGLAPCFPFGLAPDALALPLTEERLEELNDNIVETGLSADQIPPLERPNYSDLSSAALTLDREDIVFVVEAEEGNYVYPQEILVWHEIVNEMFNGRRASLTYCPLTGSVMGFYGQVRRHNTTFGTSGRLLNSNLVMYDRATGSLWPQILGAAIDGPLRGVTLEQFQVHWTTYGRALKTYKQGKVLTRATGFTRDYGRDPYGSYSSEGGYYRDERLKYPVMYRDERLPLKEPVMAFMVGEQPVAVVKKAVREKKVVSIDVGAEALVALWDGELGTARIFDRHVGGLTHSFRALGDQVVDEGSKSAWSGTGEALDGRMRGFKLTPVTSFETMWFGWSVFQPRTLVFQ